MRRVDLVHYRRRLAASLTPPPAMPISGHGFVPDGQEPTVYLVLNDFGRYGRAYSETSEERADLETTISDLITGQYDRPVRVVAFNTAEGWSADVLRARSCAALILPAMNCRQRSKASSISTLARIVSSPCGWHSPNYLGDIYSSGCPLCLRLRAQLGYRARSEKCQ